MILAYSNRQHLAALPNRPALAIHNLQLAYPRSKELALKGLSLCLPVGKHFALIGHNGAGKSTLLKAIAGLLPMQSGSILIYGHPPAACHHRVAYLPQRGEIDWRFPISLRKLVLTGRYVHLGWFKRPSRQDWAMTDAMLEKLGLSDLAQRQIGQLSGGQQQRALLARALVQESDLLLLDEPFNAIDAENREVLASLLADLCQQGISILTATHELASLETDFDKSIYLYEGHEMAKPLAYTRMKAAESL